MDTHDRAVTLQIPESDMYERRSPDGDGREHGAVDKIGGQPVVTSENVAARGGETTPLQSVYEVLPCEAGYAGSIPVSTHRAGSEPADAHSSQRDPGWARISVGQYAATHIKDFIVDLERSIPQTQTVDEAMEFATVTKELALHLLRIALEARDRAELLIERKQF